MHIELTKNTSHNFDQWYFKLVDQIKKGLLPLGFSPKISGKSFIIYHNRLCEICVATAPFIGFNYFLFFRAADFFFTIITFF